MKFTVSKNAFSIGGSLAFLSLIVGLWFLLYMLGLPWWIKYLSAAAIGLGVRPLRRRWPVLDLFFGDSPLEKVRIGPFSFNLLPPPRYTAKRKLILCLIFCLWLSAVITPLVFGNDRVELVVMTFFLAPVTSILILDVLEKRWLAPPTSDHG